MAVPQQENKYASNQQQICISYEAFILKYIMTLAARETQ